MDDDLKKKLALWKVKPEVPLDFQRGVWDRIAARESRSSKGPFESLLATRWLTLPRLAVCAFALGGFTGTGLGLIESAHANTKNWKTLEVKYVQAIDPYQQVRTY